MRRGDIVTVAAPGDYGKPRLAVVVQSDALHSTDSVLVALLTTTLASASFHRLDLVPDSQNGLLRPSQVMVDKILAVPRVKCGPVIGRIDPASIAKLDRLLALTLGLAD